jgi:hypothetical protein
MKQVEVRVVGEHLPDYTALHRRRENSLATSSRGADSMSSGKLADKLNTTQLWKQDTCCREILKTSVDSRVLGNVGKSVHHNIMLLSKNVIYI